MVARVRGELLQRERVLGEARAAPADARAQEVRPEPVIEADPFGDVLDVGADELADVGDLVDEADARDEERVRRELDHLRGVDVRAHDRRVDAAVERLDASPSSSANAPITIRSGSMKSRTAVPSAVNSGFET